MLSIAVLVIFLGTIYFVINQHINNKINNESKLSNVIDKVNYNQGYSYDTMQKQRIQLNSINNDLQITKLNYLKKIEAENALNTKKITAEDYYVKNKMTFLNDSEINLNKNKVSFSNRDISIDTDNLNIGDNIFFNKDSLSIDKINLNGTSMNSSKYNDKSFLNVSDGINTDELNVYKNAQLENVTINNNQVINGSLNIKGAKSFFNTFRNDTIFNDNETNKNLIRGDTDLLGNTSNLGNFNNDGTFYNMKNSVFMSNMKIGHNRTDGIEKAIISAYAPPNTLGASFGSVFFSHLPFSDGNTYIRGGDTNKDINIGDIGNGKVFIGNSNMNTTINNDLNILGKINMNNNVKFSSSNSIIGNYNISGPSSSFYNINNQGNLITNKGIYTDSINPYMSNTLVINSSNANNQGVEIMQGLSITNGGGISIGKKQKTLDGSLYVDKSIQIGHSNSIFNDVPISTSTVLGNNGAMFGGPNLWSHFPNKDGNTYIRPGKTGGDIYIGDTQTKNVNMGDLNTNMNIGGKILMSNNNINVLSSNDINISALSNLNFQGNIKFTTDPLIKNSIDSWDTNKKIQMGWNSYSTLLGNANTGGSNYAYKMPQNTVTSANDFYVYGKSTSTTGLCINNTCINEGDLLKIKTFI